MNRSIFTRAAIVHDGDELPIVFVLLFEDSLPSGTNAEQKLVNNIYCMIEKLDNELLILTSILN